MHYSGILQRLDRKNPSFTLIELLIVVAIIGILAALIIVSITSASAKARDVKRQEDLKNIQKALEMYYTANGSYPVTNASGVSWQGNCSGYGSHPVSGSNGYVPNLAPTYIPSLPIDPRQTITHDGTYSAAACYLYSSNGTDYKIIAYETVETVIPTQTNALADFWDPGRGLGSVGYDQGDPGNASYALFTPGAKYW